jgi:hypothetical protein
MRSRYAVLIILLLLLIVLRVQAKGRVDRIVLTGPAVEGEMILNEPSLVAALSMGSLEDFLAGAFEEPDGKGVAYYDLERQMQVSADRFQTIDRVRFYPGEGIQPGFVHYLGLENGWTEYDGDWFFARPEATAAFRTAFNAHAQPYLVLVQERGHLFMADPVTLVDVVDMAVLDPDARLHAVADGPDATTLYITTANAGFRQHYRIDVADRTACWADVIPPAISQPAGLLWTAGSVAQKLSDEMQGTWLEPIAEKDRRVLLYHPLGRYHNYDYGAEDRGEIPGGILLYTYDRQPRLIDQWQADKRFAQVIEGDSVLYALEAPRGEDRVELYALDGANGEILHSRTLAAGRWSLGHAILDLTSLPAQTRISFADRCRFDGWEIPQTWRMPQAVTANR